MPTIVPVFVSVVVSTVRLNVSFTGASRLTPVEPPDGAAVTVSGGGGAETVNVQLIPDASALPS